MDKLVKIISKNEEFLMQTLLTYASKNNYTKYSLILKKAWLESLRGLSKALLDAINSYKTIPELNCDDDFMEDPLISVGIVQIKQHLERGVTVQMFMGLFKYYRQSYIDLVNDSPFSENEKEYYRLFINRCFDRFEIGFIAGLFNNTNSKTNEDLQNKNYLLTNEKNKFLTIFESLPNPVIFVDETGKIINANFAAVQMLEKYTSAPGTHYCTDVSCLNLNSWLEEEISAFQQGTELDYSFKKELQIGENKKRYEVKFVRMLDISKKFCGITIILHDITERINMEQRLAQEINVEASLVKLSQEILSSDSINVISSQVLDLSRSLTGSKFGYVGYVDSQTGKFICPSITKDIWSVYPAGVSDLTIEHKGGFLGLALNSQEPIFTNNMSIDPRAKGTPLGHHIIQRFLAVPAVVNGVTVGLVGLANPSRDFTWADVRLIERIANLYASAILRIQAEILQRETNQKLNAVIQGSPMAIILLDIKSTVLSWNTSAERIFGWKSEEVIGRTYPLIPKGKEKEFQAVFEQVIAGDKVMGHEVKRKRKDGSLLDVRVFYAPLYDLNSKVIGVMAMLDDVTKRKKSERILKEQHKKIRAELELAADVQQELLPKNLPVLPGVSFAWKFEPSVFMAGDMLNVFQINNSHIGFYILDVKGHGISAALQAISFTYFIKNIQDDIFKNSILSPSKVLNRLNEGYAGNCSGKNFLTIFYGILNSKTKKLIYAQAGHCQPIVLTKTGQTTELKRGGPAIGFLNEFSYKDEEYTLNQGDKLILYTDGLIEVENDKGQPYGLDRLINFIKLNKDKPISEFTSLTINEVKHYIGKVPPCDDITMVGVEIE